MIPQSCTNPSINKILYQNSKHGEINLTLHNQKSTGQEYHLPFKVCHCAVCSVMSNSLDHSPPGSSVHGISQARVLEWVAMSSSRGSSQSRDCAQVSCVPCIAGGFFAGGLFTGEPLGKPIQSIDFATY